MVARGAGLLVHPSWTPLPGQMEKLSPHQAGTMSQMLHTASGTHVCVAQWSARPHVGMLTLRLRVSQLASPLWRAGLSDS